MTSEAKKRTTIKDVSREAGVSLSTVSGILNGIDEFSEKTKKKVWDAAHSLNYVPNSQARLLRARNDLNGRRKTGIIIHITHLGGETPVGNMFEAQRSQMISWEAASQGLYPISYFYHYLKGFQCPPVLDGTVDGAIVGTPHLEVVNALREKLPMVLMDVPFNIENADVPMVNMDIRHGISLLINQLSLCGHRKIGMMYSGYLSDSKYSLEIPIMNMFQEIARSSGIEVLSAAIKTEIINPENHEEKMRKIAGQFAPLIRNREITAIACPNTIYAETLSKNLSSLGVKVPDDISLISMIHPDFGMPPSGICSMLYNWPQLIKTSLRVLKEMIGNKESNCMNYQIKPEIHIGSSVKTAK